MEAVDSPHLAEEAGLENKRALRIPMALHNPNPEACQGLQKPICPAADWEVIQQELVRCDPEVEPLPFGIFINTNSTIKVGAIILMDGVAVDAAEPTVGVR